MNSPAIITALAPRRGRARMTFAALGHGFDHRARLVRADDPHARRFADDGERGLDAGSLEIVEQPAHADTADLFIEREGEMQRPLQVGALNSGSSASAVPMNPFMSQAPRP